MQIIAIYISFSIVFSSSTCLQAENLGDFLAHFVMPLAELLFIVAASFFLVASFIYRIRIRRIWSVSTLRRDLLGKLHTSINDHLRNVFYNCWLLTNNENTIGNLPFALLLLVPTGQTKVGRIFERR